MNNYDWAILTRKQVSAMKSNAGDVEHRLLCGIAEKLEDYLQAMYELHKESKNE